MNNEQPSTEVPPGPETFAVAALTLESTDDAAGESELACDRLPRRIKVVNLCGVILPFAAAISAIVLLWGVAFNWVYLALLLGMFVFSGLGITIGYHRLFTHKSFATTRFMTWLWGVAGSSAAEGSILEWVAFHRKHHQYSDTSQDPHSPHAHPHDDGELPTTVWGFVKGFWHSHMGWFVARSDTDQATLERYVPDLMNDRLVVSISRHWRLWTLIGCVFPAIIAGVVTMSWTGALLGFLWGGLVRIFFVHHTTWSINSVCHIWGSRPFVSRDHSRNNLLFGILAFGEGWHNNHHAFPVSARHGLRWWQIDTSWLLILAMKHLGIAWNVKVPTQERMDAKLRKSA
ncbi:MAG: acyl-CoA desaturase [Phycisphaerales bacterium]